jgi:hypothetical protein
VLRIPCTRLIEIVGRAESCVVLFGFAAVLVIAAVLEVRVGLRLVECVNQEGRRLFGLLADTEQLLDLGGDVGGRPCR